MHFSTLLTSPLELGDPSKTNFSGGTIAVRQAIAGLIADERVTHFTIYFPPEGMARPDKLQEAAESILPPSRRGKGVLRFQVLHSIPEAFAEAGPQVLWCPDLLLYRRYRTLRDRFAQAACPIIFDTHGVATSEFYDGLGHFAESDWPAGDTILAISEAVKVLLEKAFRDYLQFQSSPLIENVHHGIDVPQSDSQPDRTKVREKLGWPTDGTIVLYRGRLTPAGKADLLPVIDVFSKVARPTDYLVLGGPEWMPDYCKVLAERALQLGIGDQVIFHGATATHDERLDPFHAADIFLFPTDTHQESQGMVVGEAMALGLPVVSTDWSGVRDHVTDGVEGFLVPMRFLPGLERLGQFAPWNATNSEYLGTGQCAVWDKDAMAESLSRLLNDPELRAQMGEAGRKRFRDTLTLEQRADKILKIAERALVAADGISYEDKSTLRALPYHPLYHHFGSPNLPEDFQLVLSERGIRMREGKERIAFYDDLAPLLSPKSIEYILTGVGKIPVSATETVQRCAARHQVPEDMVWMAIGVCIKAGILDTRAFS